MDKVKLHAQQRLDLDDARALQTLVYNYIAEALGGVLGHVSGCLSRVQTIAVGPNTAAPTYIELGAFSFITTTRQGSSSFSNTYHQARTVVVNYDPSDSGQNTQINFEQARNNHTAYDGTSAGGKLWARPIYQNTDTANRIKWESSASKEATFSAQTRESQRVEFQFATSEPSRGGGERWSAIALVSIANGDPDTIPFLIPISAWDTDQNESLLDTWFETSGVSRDNRSFRDLLLADVNFPTETDGELRMSGLALQLSAIRLQLSRLLSLGSNDSSVTAQDWYDQPLASVAGLHARTAALESAGAIPLAYCVVEGNRAATTPYYTWSLATGYPHFGLVDTGRAPVRGNSISASPPAQMHRVNIELDIAYVTQSNVRITSVQCTPCSDRSFVVVTHNNNNYEHYNYNRIYCHVNPEVYAQALGGGEFSFNRLDAGDLEKNSPSDLFYGVIVDVLPHVIDTPHAAQGDSEVEFNPPNNFSIPAGDASHIFNVGETVKFAVIIHGTRV